MPTIRKSGIHWFQAGGNHQKPYSRFNNAGSTLLANKLVVANQSDSEDGGGLNLQVLTGDCSLQKFSENPRTLTLAWIRIIDPLFSYWGNTINR